MKSGLRARCAARACSHRARRSALLALGTLPFSKAASCFSVHFLDTLLAFSLFTFFRFHPFGGIVNSYRGELAAAPRDAAGLAVTAPTRPA